MSKRTMTVVGLVIILTTLILAACQPATPQVVVTEAPPVAPTPCVVKVGSPTLITGWGAPMGVEITNGVKLAVEKINIEGGILGCQIDIVYADVKNGNAEDCALAAQVMDQAGVIAYFPGAFFGSACIDEFGKREPLLLHWSASKDHTDLVVANLPEYRNIFQSCEDEPMYGTNEYTVIVEQIGKKLGYEFPNHKVALLGGDITYDMYIQQSAKKAFEDAGWEIVLDDTYAYGNTEFGSQLAKIRAEEPAVILGQITSVDSSVAFMNQYLTNPTNSLVYIQFSPSAPEFINLLGDKANGVMWQVLSDVLPENKDWFYPMYQAEFGHTPGTFAVVVWDHVHIWKAAVESCGSFTDYDCIDTYVEQLSQHPYKGLTGTYGMFPDKHKSPSGDEWVPIQFLQIQDQKNVLLYAASKQIGEFQVPPWIK